MTDDPASNDDMFSAMDKLQLDSRRAIDRTLPVDPVHEFDDVPTPETGTADDMLFDIDLGAFEADPSAPEPDVVDFEIDLPEVEEL